RMQDYGWFQWFAYVHTANFNVIHNCEIFLPWHRRFLKDFENVGRQFTPTFALPYWDEVRDYANPAASTVLTTAYAGSNGVGSNRCVQNGLQNGWTMTYPSNHCLRRQYNNGNTINPMYSPEYIQSLLSRSKNMAQLRPAIEFSIHGAVHLALGGDMVQNYSPNDFAFWLHHANIDRLWFVWQMQDPNQNFWSATGVDTAGKAVGLNTALPYYSDPITNMMYPGRNGMCFSYDNFGTVTQKKRSLTEENTQKCRQRPVVTLPQLPDLVEGVFDDVNDVLADSESVIKETITNLLPEPMLNKWFPTLANNNTVTYTAEDIPEAPVVAEVPEDINTHSNLSAPSLPSESFDIAGEVVDSSYYSSPQGEVIDGDEYSASTVEVSTVYTSSVPTAAPTEAPSGSESEELGSESESDYSSSEATVAVPIPSHDASESYNANDSADYSVNYQIFDVSANPDVSGLDGVGPTYLMPNPFPFTRGFIQMHGYSINELKQHYALAQQFVGDMNAAGYQSPYAKGAKNLTSA
ncbi:hypothetical protein GGH20_003021, partial [Coemansia sp. RSA 1937]